MLNQFLTKSKITKSQNKFKSKLFGALIFSTFILNIKACDDHRLAPIAVPARKAAGAFRPRTSTIRSEVELSDGGFSKESASVLCGAPVATASVSLPERFKGFDLSGLPTIGSECAERVINIELIKLSAENRRLRRILAEKTVKIALLSEARTAKLNAQLREINSDLAKARNAHMAEISQLTRRIAVLEAGKMRLV